jgi:hypothetical protein
VVASLRPGVGKADCHFYLHWYYGGAAAELELAEQDSKTTLRLDPKLLEANAVRVLASFLSKSYEEKDQASHNH